MSESQLRINEFAVFLFEIYFKHIKYYHVQLLNTLVEASGRHKITEKVSLLEHHTVKKSRWFVRWSTKIANSFGNKTPNRSTSAHIPYRLATPSPYQLKDFVSHIIVQSGGGHFQVLVQYTGYYMVISFINITVFS